MLFLTKTPYLLKKFYPKTLIWHKTRAEKVIYLTFDDGPVPIVTPWVLKTLKNFNAKATFFCIGDNIIKNPEIFEQIKVDGHAIGNHTFNHLKGWKTDDETYLANILKCQGLTQTNLFRPPYGRIKKSQIKRVLSNEFQVDSIEYQDDLRIEQQRVKSKDDVRIQEASTEYQEGLRTQEQGAKNKEDLFQTQEPSSKYQDDSRIEEQLSKTQVKSEDPNLTTQYSLLATNYAILKIIMWDVLSGDFDSTLSRDKCLQNVLKHTENGSIIVFHDSLKAWDRLEYVLPKALEAWRDEGFEFGVL